MSMSLPESKPAHLNAIHHTIVARPVFNQSQHHMSTERQNIMIGRDFSIPPIFFLFCGFIWPYGHVQPLSLGGSWAGSDGKPARQPQDIAGRYVDKQKLETLLNQKFGRDYELMASVIRDLHPSPLLVYPPIC